MEVLHLPLTKEFYPRVEPQAGPGRCIARCSSQGQIDSDTIKPDTVITIVGEVRGSQPVMKSQDTQSIPVLAAKDLAIRGKDGNGGAPSTRAGVWYSPFHVPYGYRASEGSNCSLN